MCNCFDNKVGFVETVMKAFGELFIDETKKGIKLQTMEYKKQGSHIIVDQGKNQIAGYTDIKKGLFEDVPVIIFGDHTRVIKYVDQPFFLGADGVKILRSKDKNANYKYLYYALRNANIPDTGYNRHFKWLKETKINYPSVARQDEIVRILDKLSDIIDRRKTQLQGLDSLIKARFVEMFENENHEIVKAYEICDFITKGTTPPTGEISEEYNDRKIPFLKVYNLSFTGEMLFDENPQYIPKETHDGKLTRSKVYPNDVLMNIVGPPLGKFALVTNEFNEWNINQAIAIFRAKDRILPRFLLHALMQPKVIEPFIGQAVGIRQQNISLEQCRNLQIILPSLKEQQSFVEFAEQVDKSKLLSLIKLLEQLITYLYNVFIIYRQDKGEEVENHE